MNNTLPRPIPLPRPEPNGKRWEAHCGSPVLSDDEQQPPVAAPLSRNYKRLTLPSSNGTAAAAATKRGGGGPELQQMQHHFSQNRMQDNVEAHHKNHHHLNHNGLHHRHHSPPPPASPPTFSCSSDTEMHDEGADEYDEQSTIFSTRLKRAYERSQAKKNKDFTAANGATSQGSLTLSITPPRMLSISPSAQLSVDPAMTNLSTSNSSLYDNNGNSYLAGYMSHPDDMDDEPGYGQAFLNSGSGSLDSSPTKPSNGSHTFDPEGIIGSAFAPPLPPSSSLSSACQNESQSSLTRRSSVTARTHLEENMLAEREVSMILPNFLYLGGELIEEAQIEEIEKLGIRRVLNMAENCDDELVLKRWGPQGYLKVGLRDHVDQDLGECLQEAIRFIASSKTPIYVHCQAGKSRSVATVIGYLIQECHWPLKKAYDHVVERRRCMSPNIGFVSQLMQLERRILGKERAGGLVKLGDTGDALENKHRSRTTVLSRQSTL